MKETGKEEKNYPLIHGQMSKILDGVKAIAKRRKNDAQGYRFRGIDDILNEVHDLFADAQVYITSTVVSNLREERKNQKGNTLLYVILHMRFTFTAIDGSSANSETIGEAMDSGDKSSNKGMSAALKYCLMQALLIPTEDKEVEEEDHRPAPREDRGRDEEVPSRPNRREREEAQDRQPDPEPQQERRAAPAPEKPVPSKPRSWKDVIWHRKFGKVPATAPRNGGTLYLDNTLGWIYLNDPKGLAYWIKNFASEVTGPEKGDGNPDDVMLVRAFAAAKKELDADAERQEAELAQAASEGSQEESPGAAPEISDEVNDLVGEIRAFLMEIKRDEKWLLAQLKAYKHCDPEATQLTQVPVEKLRKTNSENVRKFFAGAALKEGK